MQLFIYEIRDGNIRLSGIVNEFENFRYVARYDEMGEFELVASVRLTAGVVKAERLLWPQGHDEAYVIETLTVNDTDKGLTLKAQGRTASCLWARRVMTDVVRLTGTHGAVINALFNAVTSKPYRAFPHWINGVDISLGEYITYMTDTGAIIDLVGMVAKDAALGYKTVFDPRALKLTFRIYAGIDRTSPAGKNVVFDPEFENLSDAEYTDSVQDYANVIYATGANDQDSGVPFRWTGYKPPNPGSSQNDITGYDRYEGIATFDTSQTQDGRATAQTFDTWVDSSGGYVSTMGDNPTPISNISYNHSMGAFASKELAARKRKNMITGQINTNSVLYRQRLDWDIGDIVTVSDRRINLINRERIKEIETSFDAGVQTTRITVGDWMPTLSEKIKRGKTNGRR